MSIGHSVLMYGYQSKLHQLKLPFVYVPIQRPERSKMNLNDCLHRLKSALLGKLFAFKKKNNNNNYIKLFLSKTSKYNFIFLKL